MERDNLNLGRGKLLEEHVVELSGKNKLVVIAYDSRQRIFGLSSLQTPVARWFNDLQRRLNDYNKPWLDKRKRKRQEARKFRRNGGANV